MTRPHSRLTRARLVGAGWIAAAFGILAGTAPAPASASAQEKATTFKAGWFKVEYNASAEDIGVQLFLDSEGWKTVQMRDPRGRQMLHVTANGSLLEQGGGTELFLESVEPELVELPIDEFLDRFPEGEYVLEGRDPDGVRIRRRLQFNHDIPEGPGIVTPPQGSRCPSVSGAVLIDWNPVAETIFGDPVEVEKYQVIVENDTGRHLDIIMPAAAGTALTVPGQFLAPGDYIFEVLAIEGENGNQTLTEGCFTFTG